MVSYRGCCLVALSCLCPRQIKLKLGEHGMLGVAAYVGRAVDDGIRQNKQLPLTLLKAAGKIFPVVGMLSAVIMLSGCGLWASQEIANVAVETPMPTTAEPNTEALMAKMLPPNSCPNTLKNMKFAMEQKLFLRTDFYTDENLKRFFGDYYNFHWKKNTSETKILDIYSRYEKDKLDNNDFPWFPCFAGGIIRHTIDKYHTKENVNRIETLIGTDVLVAFNKHKITHTVHIDQFIAIFGIPDAIRPRMSGELGYSSSAHPLTDPLKNLEAGRTLHRYGAKELIYKYRDANYRAVISLLTYYDGTVGKFSLSTGDY